MSQVRKPLLLRRVSTMERKVNLTSYTSKDSVAVLTSGGDAQGMNSAVRAVVRMCLHKNVTVYSVLEGYDGLIKGGDSIKKMSWSDVSNIMHKGGTIIGSARCAEFRTPEGRYTATVNLLKKNISQLIVCGGDGSLTGADYLDQEWEGNVRKAVENKDLDESCLEKKNLRIYGLVGSIDNDFAGGYQITIGTDSALHRICEAIDSIRDTAYSHKRAFVVEIMGRNCGYLALTAALCCEADYVLIPEFFGPKDWKQKMKETVERERNYGKRTTLILVAEGAVDSEGKKITCQEVSKILSEDLGLDSRITVLGHVQRGGRASAFDRIIGTRLGSDAALYIMDENYDESKIVSLRGASTIALPMMQSVSETKKLSELIAQKKYDELIEARGKSFQNYIKLFNMMKSEQGEKSEITTENKTVAIIHLGTPTVGMNPATSCAVRYLLGCGIKVLGVKSGLEGLENSLDIENLVEPMTINSTFNLMNEPGSILGTYRENKNRKLNLENISKAIAKHKIDAMLLFGNNSALEKAKKISSAKEKFPNLGIPKIIVPCSISNDLPCTFFTIGTDSSLNQIALLIESLKDSVCGSGRKIFFVEVRGQDNGYLAVMSALCSGASKCYTPESNLSVAEISNDANTIVNECGPTAVKIIICSEGLSNSNCMDIDGLIKVYEKECAGNAKCIKVSLGYLQEGCKPSPQDRKLAMKFGAKSAMKAIEMLRDGFPQEDDVLLSSQERFHRFLSLSDIANADKNSKGENWWGFIKTLVPILSDKNCDAIDYCNEIELS